MENFRDIIIKRYKESNQFGKYLGMRLTKFEADEILYELELKPEHLATPTTAHGGVIAGFMDGVLGLAALYVSSEKAKLVATIEFKINFISPVRLGDVLLGSGKVVSAGNRIIVTNGEILNKTTNKLVATATGTFNAYPYQKSGMTF